MPEPKPVEDPAKFEDPEDYGLRTALDLRPIFLPISQGTPDRRPCPPWCSRDGENRHVVDAERPHDALHMLAALPMTALTQYPGVYVEEPDSIRRTGVALQVITVHLTQLGQAEPTVTLEIPDCVEPGELRLSLDDTRDLIKALQYVVDRAEEAAS